MMQKELKMSQPETLNQKQFILPSQLSFSLIEKSTTAQRLQQRNSIQFQIKTTNFFFANLATILT
jgi:hypothetical protein